MLRRIYAHWYRVIGANLADVPGPTVELGSGIGRFKDAFPHVLATDVEATPWAEAVVDAESLAFEDASVANLVLIDVFHHLARPARFLDEARRTLAPGGRVIILDPYCSPVSTLAYRRFHHETTDLSAPALADDPNIADSPLDSNQARSTLVFFRGRRSFERRWPELAIVQDERFGFLVYPASGGFTHRPLVPATLYRPLALLERLLRPLAPLLAFRCLVVLQRRRDRLP